MTLHLIPELSRELCLRLGYKNPTQIPDQQQFRSQVLDLQIEEELKHSASGFIADRGTIDCWVMWQRWQMCSAMTYDSEAYYSKCHQSASQYTQIIYIPPLFTPPEDEFRWTDPDYIMQIDRLTRLTLYDWSLLDRTYTVRSTDLHQRAQEAFAWLTAPS